MLCSLLELKNTITDFQQYKIDYQTYLREIMSAGCCRYAVYIHTKKVSYIGRDGSYYIEDLLF
ncbi:MAG: DUF1398 domain-containing protein [Alphaproteobacteria bacterium]|nr:DUF1398 domain-containing protein [Alphaproteobacteria bacterium]